ncbi:hypothetical protein BP5796_07290 [Coleophoma crateriformis]|uniref:MI domain-containing protein n=1 Tax=Coleophoma crateriformis TaxID=565419 RepID=A0A3D8RIU2_9HELO|nr:hypothetical protein BP5796_07290 [Coleophoma crateriformis]
MRKADRVQKKALRNGPPPHKRAKTQHVPAAASPQISGSEESMPIDRKSFTSEISQVPLARGRIRSQNGKDTPAPLRSRSVTPPSSRISLAVKHKLEEDDEEIAALEKKLGLKGKKKLPQSFRDDGLDELLQGLDSEEDVLQDQVRKEKTEQDDWLSQKRKQARLKAAEVNIQDDLLTSDEESSELGDDSTSGAFASDEDYDVAVEDRQDSRGFQGHSTSDFEGFDSDTESTTQPRVRENPYVAPAQSNGNTTEKYVPPSLRRAPSSDTEALTRLRRQTQGLVNRLTEANLLSILAEIEKIYRDNPRQHVTSTLVDLLLTQVCEPTSLPDTSIIVPAGFIAAVYKIIGVDFGAQLMQRTVELFGDHYAKATALQNKGGTSFDSKETSNLITLLSELYNFQVIGSNLMFDYVRLFLERLTELNAELLLRVVRISGSQLRQDDPSALKEIVSMLGPAVASVGEENLSVRTRFMIEAINNLKNNRNKTGGVTSAINSEHLTKMKKTLGTLNTRSIKATEPLRIGLKDIQDAEKKGKWWLVGASWSGPAVEGSRDGETSGTSTKLLNKDKVPRDDSGTSDLVLLASQHRMNTDIRRAIFITIMSASDYQDAYLRLMKLRLKKVQELEIPKVLLRCSGSEKTYNPYYTLIARKLCGDRKLKMAFQFSLWDLFKKMGEGDENDGILDDDAEDDLDTRRIVNLAKMYGALIADGGLNLGVLKNLNLSYLQTKTKTFVEVLFISVFLQLKRQSKSEGDEQVARVFSRVKEHPQLIRGFQYFLKKVVSKTDIAGSKADAGTVKRGCRIVARVLDDIVASDSADRG